MNHNNWNFFNRITFDTAVHDGPTWEDRASVLKLATMWRFDAVRKKIISTLEHAHFNVNLKLAVHQLALGQKYQIRSWVLDGYYKLAARRDPLTADERKFLSPTTIWTILELRDTYEEDKGPTLFSGDNVRYTRRVITKAEVAAKVVDELKDATFES
jgi:hypothetical protein